ncbi:transmembrane protein, putative [Medicago truncatula]|uniref:Transmembrane protein, putative n=1 Tax=Medicago truncatula TaxID=3880 RepID=A0A072U941_MEDTR|nr:transmembrane protein, putative [Medicago truncatula]
MVAACVSMVEEELNQFQRNDVWDLVPKPFQKNIIGTKWVIKSRLLLFAVVSGYPSLSLLGALIRNGMRSFVDIFYSLRI